MIVSVNMSMTADGKVNIPGQQSLERIGNQADKQRMKELRRESDAILAGAGTVIADNVALGVGEEFIRVKNGLRYPLRICIVGRNLPPVDNRIFNPNLGGSTIIFCGKNEFPILNHFYNHSRVIIAGKGHRVKIKKALTILQNEFGVEKLLVEGGPSVNGSFLAADVIDRYHHDLSLPFRRRMAGYRDAG